jgi:DNA-binding NarL/FixJ family response regulator
MSSGRASVLVVDDLPAFRRTLRNVVAVCEHFELAGEAASGEEAISVVDRQSVDLVLMDVKMPGIGGIAAAHQLRRSHPDVVVMLLSVTPEQALPADLLTCGAQFCHKECFGPEVLDSLWRDRMP